MSSMQEILQGDMYKDILDTIPILLVSLQPHFEDFLKSQTSEKIKNLQTIWNSPVKNKP